MTLRYQSVPEGPGGGGVANLMSGHVNNFFAASSEIIDKLVETAENDGGLGVPQSNEDWHNHLVMDKDDAGNDVVLWSGVKATFQSTLKNVHLVTLEERIKAIQKATIYILIGFYCIPLHFNRLSRF